MSGKVFFAWIFLLGMDSRSIQIELPQEIDENDVENNL